MVENFRFLKIVLSFMVLSLLLFAMACGPDSGSDSKDSTNITNNNNNNNNNNTTINYTNANLAGTWKYTDSKDGSTSTYTFNSNGTFTSVETNSYGTFDQNGTFTITAGNKLTLTTSETSGTSPRTDGITTTGTTTSTSSETYDVAIQGNNMALPALKVVSLGTDGQGPIGTYSFAMQSTMNYGGISYMFSIVATISINDNNTFTSSVTSTTTDSSGTTTGTSTESGTWSNNGNGTLTVRTTYSSDDPAITPDNPSVENNIIFSHVNNNWVVSGRVFVKQ
ncbi:hypothetical protein HY745_13440 [Candidatus Desantisbacteria bacterium]|nr:hypothetical protein [Candidatus Desantisbacteria bacterium]